MRTNLYGITGYAGVGKTTLARRWERKFMEMRPDMTHEVVAFADALKREESVYCHVHFGVDPFTDDQVQKAKIRPHLVKMGKIGRERDPMYWVRLLEAHLRQSLPDTAIIHDVRYENEAQWLVENGGTITMLNRAGVGPANDEEASSIPLVMRFVSQTINFEEIKV